MFLDGHADFYQPEAEPNGEAASMDLALATGRGPTIVTDIERRRPSEDEQKAIYADYNALNETTGVTPGPPLGLPDAATTVRVKTVRS